MQIPNKFTIFGCQVIVEMVDFIEGNKYGTYNDATDRITIARNVKIDGKTVKLSQLQIENTFWHEVIHAWQFYIKGTTDEWEASSYSGAIIELIRSGEIKIIPNEIINNKSLIIED